MTSILTATLPIVELSWLDVLLAAALVAVAALVSLVVKLGVARDLFGGLLRATAQLVVGGLVLHAVFAWDLGLVVLLLMILMLLAGAWMAFRRVAGEVPGAFGTALLALSLGSLGTCAVVCYGIVGIDPWYAPRYVVPLFGLVLGSAMSGVALGLARLGQELRQQRGEIELLLSLGATRFQAARGPLRRSLQAALSPVLSGPLSLGVVFLPGVMSGQLLAGVDPLLAVRYQLLVVLALTFSAALSSYTAVVLAARRCFTAAHQLLV